MTDIETRTVSLPARIAQMVQTFAAEHRLGFDAALAQLASLGFASAPTRPRVLKDLVFDVIWPDPDGPPGARVFTWGSQPPPGWFLDTETGAITFDPRKL